MLICMAIINLCVWQFWHQLHSTKWIDTPLKFLETAHPSVVSKSRDYFSRKQKELYQQKGAFYKQASIPSNALLSSYKVAHRIAKYKEPHTIAKELIPSNAVDMVNLMIGESAELSALALMKSKYRLKNQCGKENFQFNSTIWENVRKIRLINSMNNCNAICWVSSFSFSLTR